MSMSNKVYELLNEFSIRMNDRPERRPEDERDDEFDFSFDDDSAFDDSSVDMDMDMDMDMDFDSEDDFVDREFNRPDDDEFGGEEFPDGLDDVDAADGEFGGERKVDITDRLKKLLGRRGETEDELNDKIGDTPRSLSLSDVNDYDREDRARRNHSDRPDMGRRRVGREPEPDMSRRRMRR